MLPRFVSGDRAPRCLVTPKPKVIKTFTTKPFFFNLKLEFYKIEGLSRRGEIKYIYIYFLNLKLEFYKIKGLSRHGEIN